jgi:hypothetical protein
MPGRKDSYIIFRLDVSGTSPYPKLFLTRDSHWSSLPGSARRGTLAALKTLAKKMRSEYPDLIIEKDDGENAERHNMRNWLSSGI